MNQMSRIAAAPAEWFPARFTTAEFLRMIDSDVFGDDKVELVEGELHRMPPPGNDHSRRVMDVVAGLLSIVSKSLVRAEAGLDLGDDTVVACDALLLGRKVAGRGMIKAKNVVLVVEVAETTRNRDLRLKNRKYAEAGIPVYWVVDANRSVVHVHAEPVEGEYVDIHTVRFGQPLAVPGTDGSITLD